MTAALTEAPMLGEKPAHTVIVDAALEYARHGDDVFPVWHAEGGRCGCCTHDCKSPGKHPIGSCAPNGVKDATTDEATIRRWWTMYPRANIGLSTETRLVLDVDPRHGGDETLAELERQHGGLPLTPLVLTGGGGSHYHLAMPTLPLGCSTGKIGPGLDTRGVGGYVLVPPSNHVTGGVYRDDADRAPFDTPLAPVPAWMLARLAGPTPSANGGPPTTEATNWAALLAGAREGERHAVAARIAGHYLGKGLPPAEVEQILVGYTARCAPPFSAAEARRIVQDLAEKDRRAKITKPEKPGGTLDEIDREKPRCTDVGNAERFAKANAGKALYVPGAGWLVWDGRRWADGEANGEVSRRAMKVAKSILVEASKASDSKERDELIAWSKSSEAAARIRGMVELAEDLTPMRIPNDEWQRSDEPPLDVDPFRFNVRNGTIELRTGELHPHRKEDRITKMAPVAYNPDAESPLWQGLLKLVFDGNENLAAYMRRFLGYCLTGSNREQVFVVAYGAGENGKSTLLDTVRLVLGDYAMESPCETFLVKKSGGTATNDLAAMRGRRMVIIGETPQGQTTGRIVNARPGARVPLCTRARAQRNGGSMKTVEQSRAFQLFRQVVEPLGLRVQADPEGFPVVRGRRGQIEWYCDGVDCHSCPLPGQVTLAVYTTGRMTRQKILDVPGVKPHQRGDVELRAVFLPASLPAVAEVIRARRRRTLSDAQRAVLEQARARSPIARRANVGVDLVAGAR
jgi:putative DNA primase/helicase